MIQLPDLPYKHDALEPHISKKTLDFHYGKHHKGYVDNLNKLIKGTEYENMELEDIIKKSSGPIYNNAAQIWNHTFYWNCMSPDAHQPDDNMEIADAINNTFNSFEKFKEQFIEKATKLFGSGWVWLIDDNGLKIKQMTNAHEPLSKNMKPILVCDVWEHGYYLDYQNDRGKYVKAFFSVVDWNNINKNYIAA